MVLWNAELGVVAIDGWSCCGAVAGRREAPLTRLMGASLGDEGLSSRFHGWRGRSGRRYTMTVFAIDHDDPSGSVMGLGPAILLAVARRGRLRDAVGMVAVESESDWRRLAMSSHAGADEWHVHLLARDRAARASVLADIRGEGRMAGVA